MKIIFLAGIPASGKSSFGAWLEDTHAYLHLDVERDGQLAAHGLVDAWNACFIGGKVESFVRALGKRDQPIILNWGFPPQWLSVVRQLKATSIKLWWFDADPVAARTSFLARGDAPIENFDSQMMQIKSNWAAIEATFRPNIITTLSASGTRLAPTIIYNAMFLGSQSDQA